MLAVSATAWAAEEGHGAEDTPSLFTGNLGNVIWTLLTFAVVIYILGRFAWRPILNGLSKREAFIRDSLEQARKDREDSERRLAEYTEQLHKARDEASAIVEEGRRDAEVVKRSIQEEARKEAEALLARTRQELQLARDSAVRELYDLAADLATQAAGRIIRRQLSSADHADLVRDAIAEIGRSHESDGSEAQN
jgi:F-type H+-transporting ATPase subunit b